MELIYRIQINVVSMIFLATVMVMAWFRLERKNHLNRLFFLLSGVIFFQLGFETITCIINRNPDPTAIFFSHVFHILLFITAPTLTLIWYFLVRRLICQSPTCKGLTWTCSVPLVIAIIIVILNPFFSFVFSVSEAGVYQRELGFFFISFVTYFYLLLSLVYILVHRKQMIAHELTLFLIFTIVPVLGGLLQTLFYGLLLMWSSTALSLIFIYIFLQERMIHVDHLTGAWTRQSLAHYLDREFVVEHRKPVGMIYYDVDDLKAINDSFGHPEGDQALLESISIIRSGLTRDAIIARMGGDEFAVVFEASSIDDVSSQLDLIRQSFLVRNQNTEKPYPLHCSFGFGLLDDSTGSLEEFYRRIDFLMYEEKQRNKEKTQTN